MSDSTNPGGVGAPTGDALIELIGVMDRLRSPGGCPWDAKQTHESLVEYLIEETYETVEAIEDGDDSALIEELGDLLLQVVFHSRIGQEASKPWNIDDVARGISEKLIRRHDYVFGDAPIDDAAGSEQSWQAQKAVEKGRESVTDGVPMAMPSLVLAAKLMRRADRGGVDVAVASAPALAKAEAFLAEAESEQELGELLLALVAAGQARQIDADAALRSSIRQFRQRVIAAES